MVLDADGNSTGGDPDGGYSPSVDKIIGGCVDSSSNPIVCTSPIPSGQLLSTIRYIKFVDTSGSGVWQPGEPIVYDCNPNVCDNNVYDYNDPVIIGPVPPVDTLLMKTIQEQTRALFDMVEQYSASGGTEWVKNGSFETGTLTGWGQVDMQVGWFFVSSATSLPPGGHSVEGSVTGGMSSRAFTPAFSTRSSPFPRLTISWTTNRGWR